MADMSDEDRGLVGLLIALAIMAFSFAHCVETLVASLLRQPHARNAE